MISVPPLALICVALVGVVVGFSLAAHVVYTHGYSASLENVRCRHCARILTRFSIFLRHGFTSHLCETCANPPAEPEPTEFLGGLLYVCHRCGLETDNTHGWRHHNSGEVHCLVCPVCFDCLEREGLEPR